MLDWLAQNKQWVFSGFGVAVLMALFSLIRLRGANAGSPKLRVNLAFGLLGFGPQLSDQMLLFTVANPSTRPIQLTGIKIPLKKKGMIFPSLAGERGLPCTVDPGTNVKFWVELSVVERALHAEGYHGQTKLRMVASDALGHEHKSNFVKVGA